MTYGEYYDIALRVEAYVYRTPGSPWRASIELQRPSVGN